MDTKVLLEEIKSKFSTTGKVEHPFQMGQVRFHSGKQHWLQAENC